MSRFIVRDFSLSMVGSEGKIWIKKLTLEEAIEWIKKDWLFAVLKKDSNTLIFTIEKSSSTQDFQLKVDDEVLVYRIKEDLLPLEENFSIDENNIEIFLVKKLA